MSTSCVSRCDSTHVHVSGTTSQRAFKGSQVVAAIFLTLGSLSLVGAIAFEAAPLLLAGIVAIAFGSIILLTSFVGPSTLRHHHSRPRFVEEPIIVDRRPVVVARPPVVVASSPPVVVARPPVVVASPPVHTTYVQSPAVVPSRGDSRQDNPLRRAGFAAPSEVLPGERRGRPARR